MREGYMAKVRIKRKWSTFQLFTSMQLWELFFVMGWIGFGLGTGSPGHVIAGFYLLWGTIHEFRARIWQHATLRLIEQMVEAGVDPEVDSYGD